MHYYVYTVGGRGGGGSESEINKAHAKINIKRWVVVGGCGQGGDVMKKTENGVL